MSQVSVSSVRPFAKLLLPADEADFQAYRVTPQVGRTDFDQPLAPVPLPELALGLE